MNKAGFLSKVVAVCLSIVLVVFLGIYAIPRLTLTVGGQPADWGINWLTSSEPLTEFEEQALLQQAYASNLEDDIVHTLEQMTGAGTVQATVRVQLNLEKTQESYHKPRYREQTDRIAGVVEDLSVTVLIDGRMVSDRSGHQIYQPRTKAEMRQYSDTVKNLIGFNIDRGDRVSVQNVPFEKAEPYFLKLPLTVWINGILFLLFIGVVIALLTAFLLPLLRQIVRSGSDSGLTGSGYSDYLNRVLTICRQSPDRAAKILEIWIRDTNQRRHLNAYTLPERAAIVVLGIGTDEAKPLLIRLSDSDMKLLGLAMKRLGRVSSSDIQGSLSLFLKQFYTPSFVAGTTEQVQELFMHTRSDGRGLFSEIQLTENGQTIWDRFSGLSMGQILSFIQRQNPETAAFILFHLSDTLSGRILTLLPQDISSKILIHLARIRQIRPAIRNRISGQIATEILELLKKKTPDGYDKISTILKTLSAREQSDLIQLVEKANPLVAKGVRSGLKEWGDILSLSEKDLRKLLKYSSADVLAAAISNEPPEVQTVFAQQMSPAAWDQVQSKMGQGNKTAARHILIKTAQELKLFG